MTTDTNPHTPTQTADDKTLTLTFNHPRGGSQFQAELGPATTGTHAIDGLIREGFMAPRSNERTYTLQRDKTGTSVPLGEPLASLGIANGEVLTVIQTNCGAARLDRTQLRSRLAADHAVVTRMRAPTLGEIRTYESAEALAARRTIAPEAASAGKATLYLVDFTFPMLAANGGTLSKATARFDLLAGGNYPFSAPVVQFLAPYPWCLHVQPASGTVCLGNGWEESRGRMLLGQLIVHVMRLANFDEPDRGLTHDAYDPRALRYWRETLKTGPLNPNLIYPALPSEITHGNRPPENSTPLFTSARPRPADTPLFAPAGASRSVVFQTARRPA